MILHVICTENWLKLLFEMDAHIGALVSKNHKTKKTCYFGLHPSSLISRSILQLFHFWKRDPIWQWIVQN